MTDPVASPDESSSASAAQPAADKAVQNPRPNAYAGKPPPRPRTAEEIERSKKIKRNSLYLLGLVVIIGIVLFSGRTRTPPAQISAPPVAQKDSPELTPPEIADKVKGQDDKRATRALQEDALNAGVVVVPTPTREFDDPLMGYGATAAGTPIPGDLGETGGIRAKPRREKPEKPEDPNAQFNAYLNGIGAIESVPLAPPVQSMTLIRSVKSEAGVAGRANPGSGSRVVDQAVAASDRGTPEASNEPGVRRAKPGDLMIATLDFKADSDNTRFLQATIQSGPYRGAKVIGAFTLGRDRLQLNFSTISWKGGTSTIRAIGVNPEQPEIGLADSVNRHYLERFGGIIVASIVAGVGAEKAREGTTVENNPTTGETQTTVPRRSTGDYALIGAGRAAAVAGDIIEDITNRPPTIIVEAGTPVGVNFIADWIDYPGRAEQVMNAELKFSDVNSPTPSGNFGGAPISGPSIQTPLNQAPRFNPANRTTP